MHNWVSLEGVEVGDVLLCRKARKGLLEWRISRETSSVYTHAAIFIGDCRVAGARRKQIEISPLPAIWEAYDHVAVFRRPNEWSVRLQRVLEKLASSLFSVGRTRNRRDGIRPLEVPGWMVLRIDQGISERAVLLFGLERGKRAYRRRGGGNMEIEPYGDFQGRWEESENQPLVFLAFHGPPFPRPAISTARHFHGPPFPRPAISTTELDVQVRLLAPRWRT